MQIFEVYRTTFTVYILLEIQLRDMWQICPRDIKTSGVAQTGDQKISDQDLINNYKIEGVPYSIFSYLTMV
jgi:hypothetical protein